MLAPTSAKALYRGSNRPDVLMMGGIAGTLLGGFPLYVGLVR